MQKVLYTYILHLGGLIKDILGYKPTSTFALCECSKFGGPIDEALRTVYATTEQILDLKNNVVRVTVQLTISPVLC